MPHTSRAGDVVVVATDDTFDRDVLQQDGPVLVDFWAQWCPPCHMIAPVLADLARERAGTLTVVKLDTDENPVTPANYRVLSLPTLMLFRGGEVVQSLVGARPKARLLAELDEALSW
ncbi:thioredoxin [Jiangella asiatica]|uniref:Thioredoxin n=1 Tax=Jiangella asiatica TaxID=2530372 RepID=A0A4R5DGB7_9ACTN|nr:thioredoxin [Jiangella asiatica]TDE10980.1 thioredoxin [Jiangella asiatica]